MHFAPPSATIRKATHMGNLITTPNIPDPDGFYAELLDLHDSQDKATSDAINAQLILILANHIGDREILQQAFALAAQERTKS
jgi:hypothetical protein